MKQTIFLLTVAFACFMNIGKANNISVSNVSITGQNTGSNFTLVEFDISWDNSWRTSTYESNWDAAWVFVKWRLKTQTTWNHATLNTTGHTAPTGSTIDAPSDGKGVFIYKNGDGIATNTWTNAQLRWNYGVDGLLDGDRVEVCVFAIEMVYIPQGSYYLGDGTVTDIEGQFEAGTTGASFFLTSEASITLGGGGAGSLGNNNTLGMNPSNEDDFDDVATETLPAAFPKGYNAFYMMKYEITQEQYAEFLNKLTRTQQASRMVTTVGNFLTLVGTDASPQFRNGVKLMSDPGGSSPRVNGNDLNDNDIAGEADDGQNIACNFLNGDDMMAYMDWTGLRPMTELEFEKACRGSNLSAVADEYAWGNTTITAATGIANSGLTNETASNAGANCVYGNDAGVQGPMRAGNFAQTTNRQNSGGSYYGVMELSGNLYEGIVSVGFASSRAFTGEHGDGNLNTAGDANVTNWTFLSGRGGNWYYNSTYLRISSRYYSAATFVMRSDLLGSRGVRIAP